MGESKRLYENRSTTQQPEITTTTQQEPSETVKTSQVASPFTNPDGTINEEAVRLWKERQQNLAGAAGVNPETGEVQDKNKYLTDIFGVSPEYMKRKREKEMEVEETKKKANAIYQAGALVSDMITAAMGGNVWKRDKSDISAKAEAERKRIENEQLSEEARNAAAVKGAQQSYVNSLIKAQDDFISNYGRKVNTTSTSKGIIKTEKTGGTKTTSGYHDVLDWTANRGSNNGSRGSGEKATTVNIRVKDPKTGAVSDVEGVNIPSEKAKTLANFLVSYYGELMADGKHDALKQKLIDNNILSIDGTKFNIDVMLASGVLFDDEVTRKQFLKIAKDELDQNDYDRLEEIINEYNAIDPNASQEEKLSWWDKVKSRFGWGDSDENPDDGFNPDGVEGPEGGL